jgi:hypothetical protein
LVLSFLFLSKNSAEEEAKKKRKKEEEKKTLHARGRTRKFRQ